MTIQNNKTSFASKKYWFFLLILTAFASGVMIFAQWGSLNYGYPTANLLSVKLVPYSSGLFILTSIMFIIQALKSQARRNSDTQQVRGALWLGILASALTGAILIASIWESYQILEVGHIGLNNLYQVSLLMLFVLGAVGYWFEYKNSGRGIGAILSILILLGTGFLLWLHSIGQSGVQELIPALQSYWLPWHVLANFIGYGCFMLGGVFGGIFLLRARKDRLAKSSTKEENHQLSSTRLLTCTESKKLMNYSIALGFPVFTLAVFLGALWADEAWGGYWSWDPKETWALIVWLIYGSYLHACKKRIVSDKILAFWAIFGFFATLFCYIGVNMFLSGMHSYGGV